MSNDIEAAKTTLYIQGKARELGLKFYLSPEGVIILSSETEVFYRSMHSLADYVGFLRGWEHAQKWHKALHSKKGNE